MFHVHRKKERPYYKKHRSVRPGGWNHLECCTCNHFKREILKNPEDHNLIQQYQDHLDRAMEGRKAYWNTRAKAVRNR